MSNDWRDLPTMADVAAAQAAGDEVEYLYCGRWVAWGGSFWSSVGVFRARPRRPATKKIKMLCWFGPSSGSLFYRAEGSTNIGANWVRVPSEDKEIEVQDD